MTAPNSSVTVQGIWRGLEGVYKKGLARSIGVSNFNVEQIERILETATVSIYSSQQIKLASSFKSIKTSHPHVKELSAKHKKTPAQILLLYAFDRNIAIEPKSVTPARIVENFQLFDFSLSFDEVHLLESTPHRQRLFMQKFLKGHSEDPFAAERQH